MATGLSVTVWQSPKFSPLIMTPAPVLEIREFPLSNNDWGAVRKPPDPLRMSWPPVLQGTAEREMMEAVEPATSSGLSGASSMGLDSSSVLWFPSDSLLLWVPDGVLSLCLRFLNQLLTCVVVRPVDAASSCFSRVEG